MTGLHSMELQTTAALAATLYQREQQLVVIPPRKRGHQAEAAATFALPPFPTFCAGATTHTTHTHQQQQLLRKFNAFFFFFLQVYLSLSCRAVERGVKKQCQRCNDSQETGGRASRRVVVVDIANRKRPAAANERLSSACVACVQKCFMCCSYAGKRGDVVANDVAAAAAVSCSLASVLHLVHWAWFNLASLRSAAGENYGQ